jgi:hypothetical protein
MRLTVEQAKALNRTGRRVKVTLNGKDISNTCTFADDKKGQVECWAVKKNADGDPILQEGFVVPLRRPEGNGMRAYKEKYSGTVVITITPTMNPLATAETTEPSGTEKEDEVCRGTSSTPV